MELNIVTDEIFYCLPVRKGLCLLNWMRNGCALLGGTVLWSVIVGSSAQCILGSQRSVLWWVFCYFLTAQRQNPFSFWVTSLLWECFWEARLCITLEKAKGLDTVSPKPTDRCVNLVPTVYFCPRFELWTKSLAFIHSCGISWQWQRFLVVFSSDWASNRILTRMKHKFSYNLCYQGFCHFMILVFWPFLQFCELLPNLVIKSFSS